MVQDWEKWWENLKGKGKEYHGPFRRKPDKIFQSNQRSVVSTTIQLRTGHGYFKSYLGQIDSDTPRGCHCDQGGLQTPAHLLLTCLLFKEARQTMRRSATRIPRLPLQLLLYTYMGAKPLTSFLSNTQVATMKWYLGLYRQGPSDEGHGNGPRTALGSIGDPGEEHSLRDGAKENS